MAIAYLVQTQPSQNGKHSSFENARRLIKGTSPVPGSLIALPEMFATGFLTNPPLTLAEHPNDPKSPTSQFLQSLANETECAVLGGGIEIFESEQFSFRNWTGLFLPGKTTPEILYRKRHPFAEEALRFSPGTEIISFSWAGFQCFPFICFDLRFPEDFRLARLHNASLFIVEAEWPQIREEHFSTLLQARAIENQAYVLACSRSGESFAPSCAFSPSGEKLLQASHSECVYQVEMDFAEVQRTRKDFPLPQPQLLKL